MQLSFNLLAFFLSSSSVLAVPLHRHNIHEGLVKREILTETIIQTRVHYERHVVVIDQNSKTISTGIEPAYTSTINDKSSQPTLSVEDVVAKVPESSVYFSTVEATFTSTQTLSAPTTFSTSKSSQGAVISSTQKPTLISTTQPTQDPTTISDPQSQSQVPDPTSSSTLPTSTDGLFSGDGTYYNTGLGSCGIESNDSQFVVALGHELYDSVNTPNPNNNPLCGRKITVFRGDKSVQVTVVDRCPGCTYTSLDLSPAAFNVLGTPEEGRIHITWKWD